MSPGGGDGWVDGGASGSGNQVGGGEGCRFRLICSNSAWSRAQWYPGGSGDSGLGPVWGGGRLTAMIRSFHKSVVAPPARNGSGGGRVRVTTAFTPRRQNRASVAAKRGSWRRVVAPGEVRAAAGRCPGRPRQPGYQRLPQQRLDAARNPVAAHHQAQRRRGRCSQGACWRLRPRHCSRPLNANGGIPRIGKSGLGWN